MPAKQHCVEIEFDGAGSPIGRLICPVSGCTPGECAWCGRDMADQEAEGCYDCRNVPEECWVKSWFDNVSVDELLHGKFTVPVQAFWDGDHPVVQIVGSAAPGSGEASENWRKLDDLLRDPDAEGKWFVEVPGPDTGEVQVTLTREEAEAVEAASRSLRSAWSARDKIRAALEEAAPNG